jgi:membrane protease YdiL (CAAX protease family)
MDREQPAPRHPFDSPVRWTGAELLLVLLVAPAVWGLLCYEALLVSGLFTRVYGPEVVAVLRHPSPQSLSDAAMVAAPFSLPPPGAPVVASITCTAPAAGMAALPAVRESWFIRTALWSRGVECLLEVATVLVVLRGVSGTTPAELGLTWSRVGRNLALGLGLALVVTPAATGLNLLVVALWKVLHSTGIHEHPFTRVGQQGLLPVEWVLLIVAAVVVAPVWEELLFRGLLQPWFASLPHGGALALGIAFLWSLAACWERIQSASAAGFVPTVLESLPVLSLLLLVPVYGLVEKLSPGPAGPALFGTAVLFGWVHARVWPTPLPLFFLGLVLGWLAYRTRSLVASITLHVAFNGAACVLLVLQSR